MPYIVDMEEPSIMRGIIPFLSTWAHVLFDTSTSRSFINAHIARLLELPIELLEKLMVVDMPRDCTLCIDDICRNCELLIANHIFVYDFVVFGMRGFDIIIGME